MVSGINSNYYNPYQKTMLEQTYYNPISYQNPNLFGGVDTTAYKEVPADGKDDGSIGFFSALGHALKGGVKFITGMFTDENGDFSLKQTLKTVGIGALIGAATFIPVIGPLVLPTLCAYGMLDGGLKVAKGFVNAMDAKTDAEAEKAWEEVGSGATEGVLSYVGYKQTGGFSKGWNQARAEFGNLTSPKQPTPTSPAQPQPEQLQLEGPKTTDVAKYESPNTTTDVAKYDASRAETANQSTNTGSQTSGAESANKTGGGSAKTNGAESANKSSGAKTETNTGANTQSSTAQSTPNPNEEFVKNVSKKVSLNGKRNLSVQEKSDLAQILDISVQELETMPKATYRRLAIKHHPDNGGSHELFCIITKLYDSSKKASAMAA